MTVQLSLQIQTDLTGLLGAQDSADFAVEKARLIQDIDTTRVDADTPTAELLDALKAQAQAWNFIPEPGPDAATDLQLLQGMLADAAQHTPVDMGALLCLIRKVVEEQRKARQEEMQSKQDQRVGMAVASKDSADKAAGERFNAGLASGVANIASGAIQIGAGAHGLQKTFGAGRSAIAAAAKEDEVHGFQQTQDSHQHTLQAHDNKIRNLREQLRDAPDCDRPALRRQLKQAREDQLAHRQLTKDHENTVVQPARAEVKRHSMSAEGMLRYVDAVGRLAQGVSQAAASCGTVTEAFYNRDAALDDNQAKLQDAMGDVYNTGAQADRDFMNNARETMSDCNSALKSYVDSATQTAENVAGRFA